MKRKSVRTRRLVPRLHKPRRRGTTGFTTWLSEARVARPSLKLGRRP